MEVKTNPIIMEDQFDVMHIDHEVCIFFFFFFFLMMMMT